MPEAATMDATKQTDSTTTTSTTDTTSLGWRAGLPDPLKTNEAFTSFKTVGDFANKYLEVSTKASELEEKLKDYVPKLPDDATDADKALYYDALGRPKEAKEYEFDGEDKNAPEWTNFWKQQFYGLGLTKSQAKSLSTQFNGQIQKIVEAHNNALKAESTTAEQKLRTEYGDKYDTNVELAKRLWQKHGETEFDKAFADGTGANRYTMIRFLLKMASLTGEDRSPQGTGPQGTKGAGTFINYDKSPKPPQKR
jgi:hypothetical protein